MHVGKLPDSDFLISIIFAPDHHGVQHQWTGHEWDWDATQWNHQTGEQYPWAAWYVHGYGHAGGEPGESRDGFTVTEQRIKHGSYQNGLVYRDELTA